MTIQHGPWKIKDTRLKYKNDFINVREDQVVRPDGTVGVYATVGIRPGVCVLPMDEEGAIYLTAQYRYALGEESLEVASGAIDKGESAEEAARRELREELGIEAAELIDLGCVETGTSILKAPVSFYLARRLTFVNPQPDGSEKIKIVKMKFGEAVRAVMEGLIVHGPSCVLILKVNYQREAYIP